MKNLPTESRLRLFFAFSAIECLSGAVYYLLLPTDPKNVVFLGLSLFRIGLIAVLLIGGTLTTLGLIGAILKRSHPSIIAQIALSRWSGILLPIPLLIISGVAISLHFSPAVLLRLAPLWVVYWLICVQYYLLLDERKPAGIHTADIHQSLATTRRAPKWLGIMGIIVTYAFLVLPSNLPSRLNGVPWNTPLEFTLAALLIPFALLIQRHFFSKRWLVIMASTLLLLKVGMLAFTPAIGLNIRLYRENQNAPDWERGYYSVFDPSVTDRMTSPYSNWLEFPIEWINQRGFNGEEDLAFRLEFWGYGTLQPGDNLTFRIQNADLAEIIWQDMTTQEISSLNMDAAAMSSENEPQAYFIENDHFRVSGQIHFSGVRAYQFEPLLIRHDGTQVPAFYQGSLWRQANGRSLPPFTFNLLRMLTHGMDWIFMALVVFGISTGALKNIQAGSMRRVDAFLAATGVALFPYALLLSEPEMGTLIPAAIIVLTLVGVIALGRDSFDSKLRADQVFLFAIGFPVLMLFISLDFHQLKEVFIFPAGQDSLAYQMYARNVFVRGDFFLLQSPPLAYKLLYPYLVGALHVLFGQSSAAQFFLNAWCAVLIALLLMQLLGKAFIPRRLLFCTGTLLVLVYSLPAFFTFFFRFGLIEPIATLCLMLSMFFASRHNWSAWLLVGIVGVLLRLDYLGAIYASILLFNQEEMVGAFKTAWVHLVTFLLRYWKRISLFAVILIIIPASIIFFYVSNYPTYVLNASDTQHAGFQSVLEGWRRILLGGSYSELTGRFAHSPVETVLLAFSLSAGAIIGLVSLVLRRGVLSRLDLRWGVIVAGFFSVFAIVKPTGYSPRFSTPLLPLSLMLLATLINLIWNRASLPAKNNPP